MARIQTKHVRINDGMSGNLRLAYKTKSVSTTLFVVVAR